MPGVLTRCLMEAYIEEPVALYSTILEFAALAVVVLCGLVLNYRYLIKLLEEKRKRPLGRKGNVIEPIATSFCIFQMIYWPYNILMHWNLVNEIIPAKYLYGWWANISYQIGIKMGRIYISWNSVFIALIRYVYIVHHERSNQWKFENVGRLFCFASFMVPFLVEAIGIFTSIYNEYQKMFPEQQMADCIARYLNVSSSTITIPYTPYTLQLTKSVLPDSMIWVLWFIHASSTFLVFSNLVDAFLYMKIFLTIKRQTKRSHEIGVLTDTTYQYSKKRSIISLKMCVMTMAYEFISNIFVLIAPIFKFKYGLANTYFTDPVSMFVIIPFLQLMNDDATKEIIFDENWYQGVKFILGLYVPSSTESIRQVQVIRNRRRPNSNQNQCQTIQNNSETSQMNTQSLANNSLLQKSNEFSLQRHKSLPDIASDSKSIPAENNKHLKRSISCFSQFSMLKESVTTIQVQTAESELQKVFTKYSYKRRNHK